MADDATQARAAKRATLTWQDFSSSGFSRTDAPLNATLQFSTPVTNSVSAWPAHSVEIHRKLKKTQKALPSFGWDTEPVLGSEEVIEEAFIDVFCDLVYGGGWLDIERCEEIDRECNWALVSGSARWLVCQDSPTSSSRWNSSRFPWPSRRSRVPLIPAPRPLSSSSKSLCRSSTDSSSLPRGVHGDDYRPFSAVVRKNSGSLPQR